MHEHHNAIFTNQIKSNRPMGIHHPHTHPTPIPMGIPIPTAVLEATYIFCVSVDVCVCVFFETHIWVIILRKTLKMMYAEV